MTDPVILTECPECGEKTRHSRDQSSKPDPLRVETDMICSECGTVRTTKEILKVDE